MKEVRYASVFSGQRDLFTKLIIGKEILLIGRGIFSEDGAGTASVDTLVGAGTSVSAGAPRP